MKTWEAWKSAFGNTVHNHHWKNIRKGAVTFILVRKAFANKIQTFQQPSTRLRIHRINKRKGAWFESELCELCYIHRYTNDNRQWNVFACKSS